MKNLIKARKLRQQIENEGITQESHPNSYPRVNAVCEVLEGATKLGTAKKWKTSRTSVDRWIKKYLTEESIDDITAIENKRINIPKGDTSNYEEHAKNLKEKLTNFDKKNNPNTYKKLNAICDVLGGMTLQKANKKWEISAKSIARYKDMYISDPINGIQKIMGSEKRELNNRDTSKDKEHAIILKQQLNELNKEVFPNTYKRLSAVCEVLEGYTLPKAAEKHNVKQRNIRLWVSWYTDKQSIDRFLPIENFPLRDRDTSKDKEYAIILRQKLNELNKRDSPNTYKRLSAVCEVLEGSTLKQAAEKLEINNCSTIIKWRDWYLEDNSIDRIKDIENFDVNQSKRDTSNDETYVQILEKEYANLDKNESQKIKKRIEALLLVYRDKKTYVEAGKFVENSDTAVKRWVDAFESKGIYGLKKIGLRLNKKKKGATKPNDTDVGRLPSSDNEDSDQESAKVTFKTNGLESTSSEDDYDGDYSKTSFYFSEDLNNLAKSPKKHARGQNSGNTPTGNGSRCKKRRIYQV